VPIEDEIQQAFISYAHEDKHQCRLFVKTIEKANLFPKVWVDTNDMRDDMGEAICIGIKRSKAVFVLLSKSYCESAMCRREWWFAIKKGIKVYHVIVRKDFKIGMYDWVELNIGQNYYYRLDTAEGLTRMIDNIRLAKNVAVPPVPSPAILPSNESIPAASNEPKNYLNKRSIAQWTSEDIREWCVDKNLRKWCEPLAHYHGPALLELRRILAVESHLQHFLNIAEITVFDVAMFRCELNHIVVRLSPRRQHSQGRSKRRTSSLNNSTK
jgi:hypothetical protein